MFTFAIQKQTQNANDMEATLNYTSREINRNFKIKVYGMVNGAKVNTLVGVAGLMKLIGDADMCNKLLKRAFNSMDDICVCKLRRGVKVSFYWI